MARLVEALRQATRSRLARYGSNTVLMVALLAGSLILANLLATRLTLRWDLTKSGQYSLADQTLKVLGQLKEPVKITGFFTAFSGNMRGPAEDLLAEYGARSDKIQYEIVDPDQQPGLARQLGVQQDATLVLQLGDKKQTANFASEREITGALIKLVSDRQVTVRFLAGHGERSPEGGGNNSYSRLKQAVEGQGMRVENLNLATSSGEGWKEGVLIIAGPTAPLLDQEQAMLRDYLEKGGRALLLLGPGTDDSFTSLVQRLGLTLGQGVVVDPAGGMFFDVTTALVPRPEPNPITEGLPATVYPRSLALVEAGQAATGVIVRNLMRSSNDSWLETDPRVAQFDEGQDTKGPLRLAVSAEDTAAGPTARMRMVVVANADAGANDILGIRGAGNMDFLLNAVNWLAEQEEQIGIRPKESSEPTVVLTAGQANAALFLSVVPLPAGALLLGVLTWLARR